ncbi:MAG: LacI family DNA-binding transcriptional regulator [Fimbriimonadaceae bacterium]
MATIRDVAARANVSTATVSKVLRGKTEHVSAETCDKVFAAVRELRYRPAAVVSRKRPVQTQNIALIIEEMGRNPVAGNPYFFHILDGVFEAAAARGFTVTLVAENYWDDVQGMVGRRYNGHCDGVILVAPSQDNPVVESFAQRGLPCVLIGSSHRVSGVSNIDLANAQAAYEITRAMIARGHRTLAYLGGSPRQFSSIERAEGFLQAVTEAGLPPSRTPVLYSNQSSADQSERPVSEPRKQPHPIVKGWGRNLVRFLYEDLHVNPTALVCWTSRLADSAVEEIRARGICVPEDVEIACFDKTDPGKSGFVPAVAVHQPLQAMGRRAVDLLLEHLLDPTLPDEHVRYTPELVFPESNEASRERRAAILETYLKNQNADGGVL